MKNFEQIKWDFPPTLARLILEELQGKEDLWLKDKSRKTLPEQIYTDTINLRSVDVSKIINNNVVNCLDTVAHADIYNLPISSSILNLVCGYLKGKPNRAMLVRLAPKSKVLPHIDGGPSKTTYYNKCDRYHLVVYSSKGSLLHADDEHVVMQTGELWWFNNLVKHWAENLSDEYRIHLIFDIEPFSGKCKRDLK